jgi:hypothetical protein
VTFVIAVAHREIIPKQLEKLGIRQEGSSEFYSEQAIIAERQGASENENSEVKPTQPKANFSSCLGICRYPKFAVTEKK